MSEKTKLYRVENPNIPVDPRTEGIGGTSHPELKGQWFSTSLDKALNYLPKATQHRPEGTGLRPFVPMDGAVIHIAEVDTDKLDMHLAANHPAVQEMDMDIEPVEDYIIPPDAVVGTLPVDDIVGESRGKMNNLIERKAATDRVRGAIALHLNQFELTKKGHEQNMLDGVTLEIANGYSDDERLRLEAATQETLRRVDAFLEGKASVVFEGLTIRISEDVDGGGEAISSENLVVLNGKRMLMSLAEMREKVPDYSDEELVGSDIDDNEVGGALRYVLVHEMGHILDELTESGNKMHRVAAAESPTNYGREADKHNSEKDHEAFAEGFAHMVYGMPVTDVLAQAIANTIGAKLAEATK